jgi:hypothetical protein
VRLSDQGGGVQNWMRCGFPSHPFKLHQLQQAHRFAKTKRDRTIPLHREGSRDPRSCRAGIHWRCGRGCRERDLAVSSGFRTTQQPYDARNSYTANEGLRRDAHLHTNPLTRRNVRDGRILAA